MFTKPKTEVKNTMSREEYEKTLKSLQDQIEELKKVEIKEDKPKKGEIWKPETQDEFCYIDEDGSPCYDDCFCGIDDGKIDCANYYKTIDEARFMSNVQKYTNLFRKYVEEHNEPLDWKNANQDKYYLKWSFYSNLIDYDIGNRIKLQGVIYASSKAILDDAIEFVGKDNVKKYVLGVRND